MIEVLLMTNSETPSTSDSVEKNLSALCASAVNQKSVSFSFALLKMVCRNLKSLSSQKCLILVPFFLCDLRGKKFLCALSAVKKESFEPYPFPFVYFVVKNLSG